VTVSVFEARDVRCGKVADVDVHVVCSTGTYVRALARDLGSALSVGGHLTRLRRTRVGSFRLDDAVTLEQLESEFALIPLAEAARAAFPTLALDDATAQAVRHGRKLDGLDLGFAGPVALFAPDDTFLALYEQRGGIARPVAVFV